MSQNHLSALDDFLNAGMAGYPPAASSGAHSVSAPPSAQNIAEEIVSPSAAMDEADRQNQLIERLTTAALESSTGFAKITSEEAFSALVVLGLDDQDQAIEDGLGRLKNEFMMWLDHARSDPLLVTALSSPTARDVCATSLADRYIDAARATSSKCYIAPLPTGKWIAVLPYDALATIEVDQLARTAHSQAIEQAVKQGKPYNQAARARYSRIHHDLSMA